MMRWYPPELPLDQLRTYPLATRESKVNTGLFATPPRPGMQMSSFFNGLPGILAGDQFRRFVDRVRAARQRGHLIAVGLGAHVIKCGMNPVLIDLIKRGWIQAIALNGAGIIHDFEIALAGKTSEDVAAVLGQGDFGMATETGRDINQAITQGVRDAGLGLGEAVGRWILDHQFPFAESSLIAQCVNHKIPVTVHVAIGTDIIHMHGAADAEAIGLGSFRDFSSMALTAKKLSGGVYINLGSAVILPEVFLKAVSIARNLGIEYSGLTTAVFDFIRHYRPAENVMKRPVLHGAGEGFYFTGHHEIMIPLLAAALVSEPVPQPPLTDAIPVSDFLAVRAELRDRGEKLVFTNGCFDLLHPGHVAYLAQARALGDRLIVAINSDASVRRLKGPDRPVQTEAVRARMLLALKSVDYVVVFDEPDPGAVIDRIIPDVLVKGGDWPVEKIIGRETVEAHGGSVRSLSFVDGHSTSDLIRRIREDR